MTDQPSLPFPSETTFGFTGARAGMTPGQQTAFADLLQRHRPGRFVHGDCVGADADAHRLVQGGLPGARIRIRPSNRSTRAWCEGAAEVLPPRPPLDRNRDIVDDADVMVACPPTAHELRRSGTWATIRYTRRRGRPLLLLLPDGTVAAERMG